MPLRKIRYIKQLVTSAMYKVISIFPSDKSAGNSEDFYVPVASNFKTDSNCLHVSYNINDNISFRRKTFLTHREKLEHESKLINKPAN